MDVTSERLVAPDTSRTSRDTAPSDDVRFGVMRWLPLFLAVAVVLAGSGVAYAIWPRSPDTDSAEAGFLRDMMTHHSQAVSMSMITYQKTDDASLRTLTYDIATSQQGQIGIMSGLLQAWDLRQTGSAPAMAWMDHELDGLMPGLASAEDVQRLRDLSPAEADILFLQLMIVHHVAGVEMAQAMLDRGDNEEALRLARSMVLAQQGEIDYMNELLVERGAEPVDVESEPGIHETHEQ